MGLPECYEGTSSPPSHRPVDCYCGSENTTGRQAIWNPVGFSSICLCSSHCSLPPCKAVFFYIKAHFFGRFCGVRNASFRRTFCCVVHQNPKTRHQGAPSSQQHDSPRRLLSTRRRLSTLDSQPFHSRRRLAARAELETPKQTKIIDGARF